MPAKPCISGIPGGRFRRGCGRTKLRRGFSAAAYFPSRSFQTRFVLVSPCRTDGTRFSSMEIYFGDVGIKRSLAGLPLCACRKGARYRGRSRSWPLVGCRVSDAISGVAVQADGKIVLAGIKRVPLLQSFHEIEV